MNAQTILRSGFNYNVFFQQLKDGSYLEEIMEPLGTILTSSLLAMH